MTNNTNPNELKLKAELIRKRILEVVNDAKGGHIGGDMSCVNLLTVLYFAKLRVDPGNPKMDDRDRFVMSKGHSVEALYVTLESAGFIPNEILDTYGKYDSALGGHPTNTTPGIEVNSGALGHGLSIGAGMALAAKMDGKSYKTYVLMGDGEQAEGSVYEAAMAASHYKLDNLVAFIDRNGLQISGHTEEVMALEPIDRRWEAFGWDVSHANGDCIEDLLRAIDGIDTGNGKPHLIIMKTTKGRGVSFMENVLKWHHGIPSEEEVEEALAEIENRIDSIRTQFEKQDKEQ